MPKKSSAPQPIESLRGMLVLLLLAAGPAVTQVANNGVSSFGSFLIAKGNVGGNCDFEELMSTAKT